MIEPLDLKKFTSSESLLEHIKAKCAEAADWAHDALTKVTEHVHAAPVGALLGLLEHTADQIEAMGGGQVLVTIERPLVAFLEAFETRLLARLEALGDRVLPVSSAAPASVVLADFPPINVGPAPVPEPAPHAEPAPSTELVAELDAGPSFPTLEDFVAQGFYAETYEFRKAEWMQLHQPAPASSQNPVENAPSDAATSAGSETA